ncbi:AAC(3) family N-acetyltransferase [Bacillus sp. REN10]|uniref:aminoglycoside N(3)-acetyltransferase n=1 Tax=Bacillus sp. REN10 TaxID=2782541 RepID=UPI00193C7174|nr:AAC(3) family N-acetyltransferase [Bacillus sp. REN10]
MGSKDLMARTKSLITRETLRQDLQAVGLKSEDYVIVHSSLSSIGWVAGGEIAVIQALMDTITIKGSIVMPAQTTHNTDPKYWENPPVPEEWWPSIRYMMPAYLPDITPTLGMGKIAEAFRSFPDVRRSSHPACSFTAWGKRADWIVDQHALDFPFGDDSPLAKLYDLDASILFIGTDYSSCTAMHLGEFRAKDDRPVFEQGSAMLENGERVWKTYKELEEYSDRFQEIGMTFEQVHHVYTGHVGQAVCKVIKLRPLVDFTAQYFHNLSKPQSDSL